MTARDGSRTGARAPVLNSPIPTGGFGRALTSSECRRLRALGWSCSTRWIVVRQVHDLDRLGIVYAPAAGRSWSHACIYVETR
jgi:hypothetical protein